MAQGVKLNLLNNQYILADDTSVEWVIDLWSSGGQLALIEPDAADASTKPHHLLLLGVGR